MLGIVLAPVIVGIVCGVILSSIFHLYTKQSNNYTFYLFGVDYTVILTIVGTFLISLGVVVLSGMAVMVRDWNYIVLYPWRFIIEFLCATLLPSISIIIMCYLRTNGKPPKKIWLLFTWSCIQFGILYVLLQISGIYRILIPNTLPIN